MKGTKTADPILESLLKPDEILFIVIFFAACQRQTLQLILLPPSVLKKKVY